MKQVKYIILVQLSFLPYFLFGQKIIDLQNNKNIRSINIESKVILDSTWVTNKIRYVEFDNWGQLLAEDFRLKEGDKHLYRYKYDEQGNMIQINTYRNQLDSLSSSSNYIYNDKNKVLSSSSFFHNYSDRFYVDSDVKETSIWSTTYTKSKFVYNRTGLLKKTIRYSTFSESKPSRRNSRYRLNRPVNKKPSKRFRVTDTRKFKYSKLEKFLKIYTKSSLPKYTETKEFNYLNDTLLQNSITKFTGNFNRITIDAFDHLGRLKTSDTKNSDNSKNRHIEYIYNDQNVLVKEKYTLGHNSSMSIQGLHYEFDIMKDIDVIYYYNDLSLIERIELYDDSKIIGKIECKYEIHK